MRHRIPPGDSTSPAHRGFAEAVRVVYDPDRITHRRQLQVFFLVAHDPTQVDRQRPDVGPRYRSIVFVGHDDERRTVSLSGLDPGQSRLPGTHRHGGHRAPVVPGRRGRAAGFRGAPPAARLRRGPTTCRGSRRCAGGSPPCTGAERRRPAASAAGTVLPPVPALNRTPAARRRACALKAACDLEVWPLPRRGSAATEEHAVRLGVSPLRHPRGHRCDHARVDRGFVREPNAIGSPGTLQPFPLLHRTLTHRSIEALHAPAPFLVPPPPTGRRREAARSR